MIDVPPFFAPNGLSIRRADFVETTGISSFHVEGIHLAVRQERPPFGTSLRGTADLWLVFIEEAFERVAAAPTAFNST